MAVKRDPQVVMAPAYQAERRRMRRPSHKFSLKTIPYQLQPFMIAPVLPGETLQTALLQARVVSDPMDNKLRLVGAWKEYYLFYVRHRDFRPDIRDDMATMMLNPAYDPSSLYSSGDVKYYHHAGSINYTKECLRVVTEEYFRDEGENWDVATIDGLPAARLYGRGQNDPFDSLTREEDYAELGVGIPTGSDASVEDLDYAYMQWQAMRDAGLMTMDYNDFIRQYGVQVREDEDSPNLHRPELIKWWRDWTYPTNTVEPTTGIPTTAYVWSIANRVDRRMFFDEPGFILGITTMRLKTYIGGQSGSVAHSMDNVQNWLPAVIHARSDVSHKLFEENTGPLGGVFTTAGKGYWLDLRDLLAYGDQYVNYAMAGEPGVVDLPKDTGARRYAAEAEIQSWFNQAEDDDENPLYEQVIREDGVVSLGILGRQSARPGQLTLGSGSLVP